MGEQSSVDPTETYVLDEDEQIELDAERLTRLLEVLKVPESPEYEDEARQD